ncbi:para-aminobenzoic acid synthetase [Macrolepiota fuliginosa MF-IS2]|uniref:aminodeoxychorismate synthase n=1 Tax=Macrolepiota fuliginosa MF-IS2 TaxID=1400762 RepID=A0A9P6BZE6_9AGAR|nr:para-aminobenzoic acid synthetase [Macrolepiota fuliginosa MF-IS2]
MAQAKPHVLLVDSYCSFAYNLAALIKKAIPGSVLHVIKNDTHAIQDLLPVLSQFSAIVIGPGPGSPDIPSDIGVVCDLWKVAEKDMVPMFGVCLGQQSLGVEHGATIHRLDTVKHGQVSVVKHTGTEIFEGLSDIKVVRYHSLYIRTKAGSEIEELAWSEDEENGKIVMGVRHLSKPFWAVQYHPESVLTDEGGLKVFQNFWKLAQEWSQRHRPSFTPKFELELPGSHIWPRVSGRYSSHAFNKSLGKVTYTAVDVPNLAILDVAELLGAHDDSKRFVFLDSAAHPGQFSILGCLDDSSPQFTHFVHENSIEVTTGATKQRHELTDKDFWTWLDEYREARKVTGGDSTIPFWGGFAGYLTYEAGFGTLGVSVPRQSGHSETNHPDVNFVWVDRSIVVDVLNSKVWVQSLLENDGEWVQEMVQKVAALPNAPTHASSTVSIKSDVPATVKFPDEAQYINDVNRCKEYLFSGNSYELCLTGLTHITVPKESKLSTWDRYKLLRDVNAAPHAGYLRLQPTTFLSSSPERFLSYSRSPGAVCELRPIKGTVRKLPHITREIATQMLAGSRKEIAENLMIVDLIRHDLHNAVGANVDVSKFCGVEEYKTVWQLVSVIEGSLPEGTPVEVDDSLGWEVLRRSLPPGSMTGAPKKRSVELLQQLEGFERGPYSGVFGYWCAGGGGDWSVTIRSVFLHDSKKNGDEEWVVGAGGAITALSDPEAELEETNVKLNGVLNGFGASA